MNVSNLKFVIAIDNYGSFSMASKKLFIAQSNLSRAVKEIEKEFDITIFERSPNGVITTREGQRFLKGARDIVARIDNLTSDYSDLADKGVSFKISVPRASYISEVFTDFINTLTEEERLRIYYQETNSMNTIRNVLDFRYDFGIIRYNSIHEGYYQSLLNLKNLKHRLILEYDQLLLTSKNSPIAEKHIRTDEDLEGCIEVVHGDNLLPTGDYVDLSEEEREERTQQKVIYIYERSSQFDILSAIPNTYMWVSPIPECLLKRYNLVQLRCGSFAKYMKDVMIFKASHKTKKQEKDFLDQLREKAREFGCYF